jgi:histidinol dehydrogenase
VTATRDRTHRSATPPSKESARPLALTRLDLRAAASPAEAARDPDLTALARRGAVPDASVRAAVREILAEVERGGSAAVAEASRRFGGGLADGRLILRGEELKAAADALDEPTRTALTAAIENVRRFARRQRPAPTITRIVPGVEIQRRWVPVSRVGAYVPGGAAAYPSSLVMTVVPARVAGVDSVVVASPAAADGSLNPTLLGAAGLLDVDALIVAGGAQAIGALAFGLPDLGIEPVDLVVGPGSAWVTAAKLELAGLTAIDMPAGPSEGMVVAEPPAAAQRVAADLITQAEHGPDSPAILVTTSADFADAVETEVRALLETAPRREILARSLGEHGRIVLVADLDAAVAVVNAYAPEHVSIDVEDPEMVVAGIRNAGSVLVGPWAPESAGDYATGANHVLPTGGLARGRGALAVETFGKFIQVQRLTRDGLAALRPTIRTLAEAEGLHAHAEAVEIRFRDDPERGADDAEPAAKPSDPPPDTSSDPQTRR